ncbi:MAG: hypothetical protein K8F25_14340, partial [Fimbriimonadaceae bacterium]|nr:hypothetical protein [Alphaproteobacteria bacterium]
MLDIRVAIQIFWLTLLAGVSSGSADNIELPDPVIPQIRALCETAKTGRLTAEKIAAIFARPLADISIIHNNQNRFDAIATATDTRMMISIHQPGAETQRTRLRAEPDHERNPTSAAYFVMMDSACKTENARLLTYDGTGIPAKLSYYTGEPLTFERMEPLNPDVPAGIDPGGVAIALVDAGVNYTLPEIAARLARKPDGQIYGRDLFDHDGRPFDLDPSGSPLLPRRHGTGVASLMMREAPDARLIPIRHPGKNSRLFAQIVDIVAAGPARIVAMPLGGKIRYDWVAFAEVAARHPELLFVVS